MKTWLIAALLITGQTSFASVFEGNCHAEYDNEAHAWTAVFDVTNGLPAHHVEKWNRMNYSISILPGNAAFADSMVLSIGRNSKYETHLRSLLSNRGFGNIMYEGAFGSVECVIKKKN